MAEPLKATLLHLKRRERAALISFGINARAALAALDEGKINGPSTEASRA